MSDRGRARIGARSLIAALGGLLVGSVLLALAIGTVSIGPGAVVGILLDHLGIQTGLSFTDTQDAVLWSIRLPRVVLAALVGAGLGVAGVGFQGIFRNPLADPQVIGVSSGAAFGAVVTILVFESTIGAFAGPIGGVFGALAAGTIVYRCLLYTSDAADALA